MQGQGAARARKHGRSAFVEKAAKAARKSRGAAAGARRGGHAREWRAAVVWIAVPDTLADAGAGGAAEDQRGRGEAVIAAGGGGPRLCSSPDRGLTRHTVP